MEISIVLSLTLLNIRGIKWAGMLESIMVVIKLFPLILVSILAFYNINVDNFNTDNYQNLHDMSTFKIILSSSVIAFCGCRIRRRRIYS